MLLSPVGVKAWGSSTKVMDSLMLREPRQKGRSKKASTWSGSEQYQRKELAFLVESLMLLGPRQKAARKRPAPGARQPAGKGAGHRSKQGAASATLCGETEVLLFAGGTNPPQAHLDCGSHGGPVHQLVAHARQLRAVQDTPAEVGWHRDHNVACRVPAAAVGRESG